MTNPIDVVKTRLMTDRSDNRMTMKNTFKSTWHNEGVAGMMKGVQVRVIYISFASILFFSSYEPIKAELSKALHKVE